MIYELAPKNTTFFCYLVKIGSCILAAIKQNVFRGKLLKESVILINAFINEGLIL